MIVIMKQVSFRNLCVEWDAIWHLLINAEKLTSSSLEKGVEGNQ